MLATSFRWGVGQLSNNQAELYALLKACQLEKAAGHNNIQIFGDSEIIIKDLSFDSNFNNPSFNVTMQRFHFILIDCALVTSYRILCDSNKLTDFKANQGCLLSTKMLNLNDCPSLMNLIP